MPRYSLIDFHLSLDANLGVNLKQSWIIRNASSAESAIWAGKVGDSLKTVDANGELITDENYKVSLIEITQVGESSCMVLFSASATKLDSIQPIQRYSQKTESSGEVTRKARLLVKAELLSQLLPPIGSLVEWCGEAFVCESSEATPSVSGDYMVDVTARAQNTIELEGVVESVDRDGVITKGRSYFVSASALNDFAVLHPVGGQEEWAGASFYLQDISMAPHGKIGYKVTLGVRELLKRILSLNRTESFEGKFGSKIHRKIVYTGRFQVPAENLDEFKFLSGTDSSSWAAPNTIVSSVSTIKKSRIEYEVVMTAEDRNNPDLYPKGSFDRSNLGNRTEVKVRLADFFLSERQCGYRATDSGFVISANWHTKECPLVTNGPLPINFVNNSLRTLLIEASSYFNGSVKSNINKLVSFGTNRVFSDTVGGHQGSFIAEDIRSEELNDDQGQEWTKITKICRQAPAGFTWNDAYWRLS